MRRVLSGRKFRAEAAGDTGLYIMPFDCLSSSVPDLMSSKGGWVGYKSHYNLPQVNNQDILL